MITITHAAPAAVPTLFGVFEIHGRARLAAKHMTETTRFSVATPRAVAA